MSVAPRQVSGGPRRLPVLRLSAPSQNNFFLSDYFSTLRRFKERPKKTSIKLRSSRMPRFRYHNYEVMSAVYKSTRDRIDGFVKRYGRHGIIKEAARFVQVKHSIITLSPSVLNIRERKPAVGTQERRIERFVAELSPKFSGRLVTNSLIQLHYCVYNEIIIYKNKTAKKIN